MDCGLRQQTARRTRCASRLLAAAPLYQRTVPGIANPTLYYWKESRENREPDPLLRAGAPCGSPEHSSWKEVGPPGAAPQPGFRPDGEGWMRLDRPDGSFVRIRVAPPKGGAP
jgi:hypothetical protein